MDNENGQSLIPLDEIYRVLAQATSIEDVRDIRNKSEALRKYVQAIGLGIEALNRVAVAKLRAERKLGKLLEQAKLRGGDRKSKLHDVSLKLADLGVTHQQSARWQKAASVPDSVFEKYVASCGKTGRTITADGLLRLAKVLNPGKKRTVTVIEEMPNDSFASLNAESHESPQDVLAELREHALTLCNILVPYSTAKGGISDLAPGQRKGVGYLAAEILRLARELGAILARDRTNARTSASAYVTKRGS